MIAAVKRLKNGKKPMIRHTRAHTTMYIHICTYTPLESVTGRAGGAVSVLVSVSVSQCQSVSVLVSVSVSVSVSDSMYTSHELYLRTYSMRQKCRAKLTSLIPNSNPNPNSDSGTPYVVPGWDMVMVLVMAMVMAMVLVSDNVGDCCCAGIVDECACGDEIT